MILSKLRYTFFLFMLVITSASAQYIQVNDTYTPQQLIGDVLLNNSCVSVSNVTVLGAAYPSGEQSYGYFSGTGTSFPFTDGIILSTGRAKLAEGPNNSLLDDGNIAGWDGDTNLEQALGINNSINATVLEFDFIPLANTISFNYMLSSEEYHDNAPCRYSDGFAFLLRESANPTAPYTNLAIIPGTSVPVKVTSVHPEIGGGNGCPAQNEAYFGAFNGAEHPTNFNGQTAVLTAFAYVTPGTQYHIKLVIADEGNYRYDSAIFLGGGSFTSEVDLGPDRLFTTGNPLCYGESLALDATTPNAIGYQWYKNGAMLPGQNAATYTATAAGDYTAEVQFTATCTAEGYITLEYDAPLNFGSFTLLQCDENTDGLTLYDLEQAGALAQNGNAALTPAAYYLSATDAANGIEIANVDNFANTTPNQPIYVRLKNQYGCSGLATVVLATSSNMVTNPAPMEECDTDGTDDGFFTFDLTSLDAEILSGLPAGVQLKYYTTYEDALLYNNPVTNPAIFANTTPYIQTIYARINQGGDCYGIAQVQLIVHSFGGALNDETLYVCEGSTLTLDPGIYKSYSWDTTPAQSTPTITVDAAGTYVVTVTNNFDCTGTKTFTVLGSGPVTGLALETTDFNGGNNTITAIAQGTGDFEYSLDGVTYQSSPVFNRLDAGLYTVFARDANGCGNPVSKSIYVLDYPKYFTPNGDSWHETWRIAHLGNRPGISVVVYDRFGRLITAFAGNAPGWDGTLNGYNLPATDYWFTITLENGRVVKGHFALIR